MKRCKASASDNKSAALLSPRSYQLERAAINAAIRRMAALSGSVEMGALRSKEWAFNVSRIATTAGVWHVAMLPIQRSTPSPPPPSTTTTTTTPSPSPPSTTTTTRSHSQCALQQRRAVHGNQTPAMAMTLSCWVAT